MAILGRSAKVSHRRRKVAPKAQHPLHGIFFTALPLCSYPRCTLFSEDGTVRAANTGCGCLRALVVQYRTVPSKIWSCYSMPQCTIFALRCALAVQRQAPAEQNPAILMMLVLVGLYPIFTFTMFMFAHPQLASLKMCYNTDVSDKVVATVLQKRSKSWAPPSAQSPQPLGDNIKGNKGTEKQQRLEGRQNLARTKSLRKFALRVSSRLSSRLSERASTMSSSQAPSTVNKLLRRASTEMRHAYRRFDSIFGYNGSHFSSVRSS